MQKLAACSSRDLRQDDLKVLLLNHGAASGSDRHFPSDRSILNNQNLKLLPMITKDTSDDELIEAAICLLRRQAARDGFIYHHPSRNCCEVDGDYIILRNSYQLLAVLKMMDVGDRVKLKTLRDDDPEWEQLLEYTEPEPEAGAAPAEDAHKGKSY
jgi:hypothetical protein